MAEILNLRQARKARERAAAAQSAEANRIRFGRGKAEKQNSAARQDIEARRLDGHKRDAPEPDA